MLNTNLILLCGRWTVNISIYSPTVRVIRHVAQKLDMDRSPFCGTAVIEFLHFWHLNETDTLSHDIHAVLNVILLIFCQLSHYLWHTSPLQEDTAIIAFSRSAINGGNSFSSVTIPPSFLWNKSRCDGTNCDKLTAEGEAQTDIFLYIALQNKIQWKLGQV